MYYNDNDNQDYFYSSGREIINASPDDEGAKVKRGQKYRRLMAATLSICIIAGGCLGFFGGSQLKSYISETGILTASNQESLNPPQISTVSHQTGIPLSISEIAALTGPTVVEVRTESIVTSYRMQQMISEGAGSGVIISEDGTIVTNHHVIDGASKITVRLQNGEVYDASLIASDKKTDLAVLKINAQGLSLAKFGDSDKLEVGEPVVAIGNPLGELGGTVTNGIISAAQREITIDGQTMSLLQTNAAINPGNSGGGLFNEYGELIGIVNAKSSGGDIEGLGFAIPSNKALSVVNDLLSLGYVDGRLLCGFEILDIPDSYTASMYGVPEPGVYVANVTAGSAAEKAGIISGDRIISFDGKQISSSGEISAILDKHSLGDTLTITVSRMGEILNLSITPAAQAPTGQIKAA